MKIIRALLTVALGALLLIEIPGLLGLTFAAVTPCEQIQTWCGEAGFTRDLPDGRDLMTKCFQPILNGQEVAHVKVDSSIVNQCKTQSVQKPKRKGRHRGLDTAS